MGTKPRLSDGRGNAMLVSGSIYQACKFYELFSKTELAGKCAIVTSYKPSASDVKGEHTGAGLTEKLSQYEIYLQMLSDWFRLPKENVAGMAEKFEEEVKKKFIDEPAQMKLLIVVDKLLTGFDAPSATYLFIDKEMRDHGLFQAICRVNRLDGNDKEYGYIVDYKDLFKKIQGAVQDYTSGAFDGYSEDDVSGLLKDRLENAREDLEQAREAVNGLCANVKEPKDTSDYNRYFVSEEPNHAQQIKDNEQKRLTFYKAVAKLIRAYAAIAGEMTDAGYTPSEAQTVKAEVEHYTSARDAVKLTSKDYIDLKQYEPDMRHLIDTYIRAEQSEKISTFDDLSLIQLIVDKGVDAVEKLPDSIKKDKDNVTEAMVNNVRKVIVDESPVNPKYYEKMSELLDNLIEERRNKKIEYEEYLAEIVKIARKVKDPSSNSAYPQSLNTGAKRAFYDNLGKDEALALRVYNAVIDSKQDDFRGNKIKLNKVRRAINEVLQDEVQTGKVLELVISNHEF
jgi:type I restriction enzyme R subunit